MRTDRDCPEWDHPPEFVVVERIDEQLRTDPTIQGILNSALGVPGTAPVPGQVGEVVTLTGQISIPAFGLSPPYDTILSLSPPLPAGDWFLWPSAIWQRVYPGVYWGIGGSLPAGFTGNLAGGFWGGNWPPAVTGVGAPSHALTTANTGLVFNVHINPGAGTFAIGNFALTVVGLRLR